LPRTNIFTFVKLSNPKLGCWRNVGSERMLSVCISLEIKRILKAS
jgi:hypothetical protein